MPVNDPTLEKISGDALHVATVKRALTGVDVVIQSLGLPMGTEGILKGTEHKKVSRVNKSARLDMGVHLPRRCGRFRRQADQ
jgi:hypothetical protein